MVIICVLMFILGLILFVKVLKNPNPTYRKSEGVVFCCALLLMITGSFVGLAII